MSLNTFFSIHFYTLGFGFINGSTNLRQYTQSIQNNITTLFLTKTLLQFKKTLYLTQKIIQSWGNFIFIYSESFYFKQMESSLFNLNPLKITKLFKGSFSNQLYKQLLNSQIDLVLIFKPEKYYFSLKEFKNLGIPTIATTTNPFLVPLIEYPVYLNAESYFLTYFLLNIYSKCIIVNKLFSLS